MARWKVHLEEEANETITEVFKREDEEETDSLDLKTSQTRLDAIRKDAH